MSEHTPGRWDVAGSEVWASGRRVASLGGAYGPKDAETRNANARLIAAAPELLEALRGLIEDVELTAEDFGGDIITEDLMTALDKARAAIAKATGK